MVRIQKVKSAVEWRKKLSKALKQFMKKNKQFNVQGGWTGKDGVTVGVLADFGIEDRDSGDEYVAIVSARYDENREYMEEHKGAWSSGKESLVESGTFMDAQNEMVRAVMDVFDVPYGARPDVTYSDIDAVATFHIAYGRWDSKYAPKNKKKESGGGFNGFMGGEDYEKRRV